jgi:phage gp29-like protein
MKKQSPKTKSLRNRGSSREPVGALILPPKPDQVSVQSAGARPLQSRITQYNRWRERYNPLRGLNVSRAVTLLEQYQRGEMADPQWAYFFIEQRDADLFAILERREAALLELPWSIKSMSGRWAKDDPRKETFDKKLAAEQASALHQAYEGIDNLYEGISHLQLATFRGYSHLEKYRNADGDVYHLELVDQWNLVRDLLRGEWKYNPDATATTFYGLADDLLLDRNNFVIRERDRHVNSIGLLKFIRANLSEKDWDGFIEIYGIPSGVVVGPPNVAPDKESEYAQAAQSIAEGGSGYLPHGSDYKANESAKGTDPFRPRLDYLSEKLVLAGTGGLLTMLAQSGSGTLAGSAHMEAFQSIARAEARKISEILQKQFDAEFLEKNFPGQPALVYFDLSPNDELDPDKIVEHALKLRQSGYAIDVEQLSEKTGYTLTLAPLPESVSVRSQQNPAQIQKDEPIETEQEEVVEEVPEGEVDATGKPITNRAGVITDQFMARAQSALAKVDSKSFKPIASRLQALLDGPDESFSSGCQALIKELPNLLGDDRESIATWEKVLGTALATGLTKETKK